MHTTKCLDELEAAQKPGTVSANFGFGSYETCVSEAGFDLEGCALNLMLWQQDFSKYSVESVSKLGENKLQKTIDKVTAALQAAKQAYDKETDPEKKASLKKYMETFTVHKKIAINEDHIDNTEDNIDKIKAQLKKLRKEEKDKKKDKKDTDDEIPIIEHTIEELIAKIKKMKEHLLVLDVHTAKDEKERKEKLAKIAHLDIEITMLGNRLPVLLKMLKEAREHHASLIAKRPVLDRTYKPVAVKKELQELDFDMGDELFL